ncbi:MAG: D-alanyl-D-alanine carboxypeptidase/D-alanyl-D-alanine-endopeptidase [Actinomycetota bacterium]|nr:D-alanyl-D-alanine carboxypeptidase/D-alanyl-D-alanine-endopeptidase [Actinomycetota bacterium]
MSRRIGPSFALLWAMASVPAIGLGALFVVADSKAEADPVTTAPTTGTVLLPQTMATPLLSVRRTPTVLATDERADTVLAAAGPLMGAIDGSSCAAIGVADQLLTTVNPELTVIPASNLKLIVAAVALDVLGPTATFTTQFVGAAPVGGVVTGDVYLVGGGDPVLSQQWYTQVSPTRKRPPFNVTSAEALADALVAAGVTSITGRLIGDGSRYDAETYPPGWSADIRADTDGVPVGALVIDDSTSTAGAISADPVAAAASTMASLLQARGVSIGGGTGTGTAAQGLAVLASAQSAPLSELLHEMLATSDNLTAEMMVKEIGRAVSASGTRTAGLAAIVQRLGTWGVPTTGIQLTDGSGLSRDNRLTCSTLMAVLMRGTATDPVGAGLARGAQPGSTLADYFAKDGLAGVIQAKTGSLSQVKSLGGYFVAGTDEVQFVVILNGSSAVSFTGVWEQLSSTLLAAAASPNADRLAPVAPVG